MNLGALKQRKKTVNVIFRLSCAMKAATAVRIRQIEKKISNFVSVKELINEHDEEVLEKIFTPFTNQNCQNKANIMITCDKGMCGDLINNFNKYLNLYSNNNDYWLIFGAKFEAMAHSDSKKFFFGNTLLDQAAIFNRAQLVYCFLLEKEICELNIHYFAKEKIVNKVIFSKERANQGRLNNEDIQDCVDNINQDYALLFLASELYQAFLSSLLAENKQRIVAMTQAKTNAEDMDKALNRIYNKARQEKITMELSETIVES